MKCEWSGTFTSLRHMEKRCLEAEYSFTELFLEHKATVGPKELAPEQADESDECDMVHIGSLLMNAISQKTCCHVDCRILTSSTMSIKTQITGVQICSPSLASIQILPRSSFRASEPAPQTRGQRAAKPDVPRGFCAKLD